MRVVAAAQPLSVHVSIHGLVMNRLTCARSRRPAAHAAPDRHALVVADGVCDAAPGLRLERRHDAIDALLPLAAVQQLQEKEEERHWYRATIRYCN